MPFDDRLFSLLVGVVIGFVAGYFVRLVQDGKEIKSEVHDMKEELDEVDEIVKHEFAPDDEDGFFKPSFTTIAMVLLVGITAYAAVLSQNASNDVKESVNRNEIVTYCNLDITSKALDALNSRSIYTVDQTKANVDLQTDFARFFNLLLHQPPYDEDKQLAAAQKYQASLNNFVKIANKTTEKIDDNPFPKVADLVSCIQERQVPGNSLEKYLDEELDKEKTEGEQ